MRRPKVFPYSELSLGVVTLRLQGALARFRDLHVRHRASTSTSRQERSRKVRTRTGRMARPYTRGAREISVPATPPHRGRGRGWGRIRSSPSQSPYSDFQPQYCDCLMSRPAVRGLVCVRAPAAIALVGLTWGTYGLASDAPGAVAGGGGALRPLVSLRPLPPPVP